MDRDGLVHLVGLCAGLHDGALCASARDSVQESAARIADSLAADILGDWRGQDATP